MKPLICKTGRYIPHPEASDAARIRFLEQYVAALSEELEQVLAEIGRALETSSCPNGQTNGL